MKYGLQLHSVRDMEERAGMRSLLKKLHKTFI